LREMAQEQGKDPEIFEFAPGGSFGRLIASDGLELLSCQEDLLVPAPEKSLGIRLSPGRAHFEGGRSEAEDLSLISLSSEPRGLGGYCQEGGLAPFRGEAFGAPMAFGDLDLYDLEVTSRSVIFSILRRGRESLFRKLEAGPVSEMRFLRQLAEDFELSLSWALAGMETALREASQALFGGGLSLLNLPWPPDASPVLRKLSGDFEASLSGYSAIIQKRAAELDRAATAVAWKALALAGRGQILEREADLLAKLSKLGLESFCLDLFHFIRTAMELSTLCLIDAGGVFGLGPARGPERLGQAFLRKIKAEPKDFEGGLEDLRRALGKMAGSFSLMADRSLTGRLRVLMAARGAAAFDWLELISVLRDMESRIIRLHWLAIIDDWGQCAGSARDIRRLIEFGPGRFCGSLMRVLSSLARIWEILQSFRRESQGPEPQAPTITNS
jgi:hypothetical protein